MVIRLQESLGNAIPKGLALCQGFFSYRKKGQELEGTSHSFCPTSFPFPVFDTRANEKDPKQQWLEKGRKWIKQTKYNSEIKYLLPP